MLYFYRLIGGAKLVSIPEESFCDKLKGELHEVIELELVIATVIINVRER